MYKKIAFYLKVLKSSIVSFFEDGMFTHAAAISYYMIFSLPSMLLIILWTAAHFYKEVTVHDAIFQKMTALVGDKAAELILSTIEKLSIQKPTLLATIIGIAVLLFFATTVFEAMRSALNIVAKVEVPESLGLTLWLLMRARLMAFAMLVSISFLLLVSLVMDVLLSSLSHYVAQWIGGFSQLLFYFNVFVLDFIATTLIFALDFRFLPDIRIKWSDAFWGALLTATLFVIGKSLIALFISSNQVVDLYDAAGSILALMLWVYYAALIFLFGATFTFHRAKSKKTGTLTSSI